jgi:hypothetical protein
MRIKSTSRKLTIIFIVKSLEAIRETSFKYLNEEEIVQINKLTVSYLLYYCLLVFFLFVARSTKYIKRLSLTERNSILISEGSKEVLIGILLGDGHIARRSDTGNSRLVYAQTAQLHNEYFNYVFNIFRPFCTNDYTPYLKLFKDKRTNKEYSSLSFTTMQLPCFNLYRDLFYYLDKKKVPDNIYKLLTDKGLAF